MTRETLPDPMHISEVLAELMTFDRDEPQSNTNCGTPGCEGWTEPTESETET